MSLIKIEKDGRELILYPGTKIKFFLKSPLFLYGPAPASRTLSFKVPAEPNDFLLNLTRLPDNRAKTWSIDGFRISLGGNYWKTAKLIVTAIKKTEYDIQLLFDKGYVADVASKKLSDFNYNKLGLPYRFMYTSLERDNFNFTPNVDNPVYSITINLRLSAVTIRSYTFTVNTGENLADFTKRAALEINSNFESDNFFAHCPSGSLEIGYIRGASIFSTTFSESSADITAVRTQYVSGGLDTQQEHISSLVNETIDSDDMIYFGVKNPGYFGSDLSIIPANFRTEWRNPMFPQTVPASDWFIVNQATATAITPFPYLYNVLVMLHEELGFKIDDKFFDEELKTLTIYNTFDQGTPYFSSGINQFFISMYFKLKDAMPDITLATFLHAIGNMFCSVFDFNSNSMEARWLKRKDILQYSSDADWTNRVNSFFDGNYSGDIYSLECKQESNDSLYGKMLKSLNAVVIKTAVNKFTDLPTSSNNYNEVRLVLAENKYYICKKGTTDTWEFFSENLNPYKQANSTVITSDAGTLFSIIQDFTEIGGELWDGVLGLYPYADQPGKSQIALSEFKECGLRLLFYRGIIFASEYTTAPAYTAHSTYKYPLGHYHNKDYNNQSIGNYSLAWEATGGLKETWWQDWLNYLETLEQYEWDTILSLHDLLNVDLLKPKRIKNQLYFIDEIEVDIGETISPATVTTYKR